MSWADLFDRAADVDVVMKDVRDAVARQRERRTPAGETDTEPEPTAQGEGEREPSPARIVADADVLAADVLVGGYAREALDHARAHSWVHLIGSDRLLDDAEAAIADVTEPGLAAEWRDRIDREAERVAHPADDHPALASAARGGAMHVITWDERLRTATVGVSIRSRVETSVKEPRAFARLFEPESLYSAVEDGEYTGPDRDPRD